MDVVGGNETTATKEEKKRKFPRPLITPTCGLHHNGKDICMRPSIFVSLLPVCVDALPDVNDVQPLSFGRYHPIPSMEFG